jgi:hypothetical protein
MTLFERAMGAPRELPYTGFHCSRDYCNRSEVVGLGFCPLCVDYLSGRTDEDPSPPPEYLRRELPETRRVA